MVMPIFGTLAKARMHDVDAVALVAFRHLGEARVAAEARIRRRKPGHRGHHARLRLAAGEQVTQAGLDENPVVRLFGVREQGAECK
jgi:hypothetical protein